jgi:hypothetical protein
MSFEEYLAGKKIDSKMFQEAEPGLWSEWSRLFDVISPESFTAQKLYLINPIRRKYLLKSPAATAHSKPGAPTAGKPVMKPRPKIN